MGILYQPLRRFTDTGEKVRYESLDLLGMGTAIVEPETIGTNELVTADAITEIAAVSTAYTGTLTKSGSQVVNTTTSVLLTDPIPAPADATTDSVVQPDQIYNHIFLTGYIELVPTTGGKTVARARFVAHNNSTTNETVTNGDIIAYAVHNGAVQVQPRSPNAALTVTAGKRWLDADGNSLNLPVNRDNMNATALPVLAMAADSITEVELKSSDMTTLASQYTGQRGVLTVAGPITVANGAKVSLGTVTITGLTGKICKPGQYAANPLLDATVTAPDTITVYARNNDFASLSVPNGTMIKVFAY